MSKFSEVLEQLRENQPKAKYGIAFEKLMVNYFRTDPTLRAQFDEVYRWSDWRYNGGKPDTGIDLVARRIDDGSWTAIQCKFYLPTTRIDKANLDSFFEASGHSFATEDGPRHFASRMIISTTDRWSSHAEAALADQIIPTSRIGVAAIAESPINWDVAFPGSEIQINLSQRETFSPRPHQQAAIDKAMEGFATHDRGKLIMACGTGKTFTALRLAERVAEERGGKARILFLVPSISLLSQTLKEWTAQARLDMRTFAVCSDSKVSRKAEDIATYDLEVPVSTDGVEIAQRFASGKRAKGLNIVFSTYQSLPAVHAAQQAGLDEFDLVICDEAHRTTGVTLAGEEASNFTKIHDAAYIKAAKRLYMTATPRLFDEAVKGKAAEHSAELASMDDEGIYGSEFYRLGFGEAVDKGLLTDYKVLVMTVDESVAAEAMARSENNQINLTLASAMIGAWNGLAKRSGALQGKKGGFDEGAAAMRRAVAFAKDIKTSTQIAESFPALVATHQELLKEHAVLSDVSLHNVDLAVAAQHVDGGMNALERGTRLSWLESPAVEDETRILTNARCLSEGVDVPALDAVIFFNPRNSMVDVVQSVGRVMRKSAGKDYGYIILPVAVAPDVSPAQALNDNTRFKVVWQILNALRAHDDRFNAKVNSIALNEGDVKELPIEVDTVTNPRKKLEDAEKDSVKNPDAFDDSKDITQQLALFSLEAWEEAMYTKLVDKVGTRTYWEDWADDVATIAENQITRIKALVDGADASLRGEFDSFVEGLRNNLNDGITEDDAISMLSQHLITAPVFNALFDNHDFITHNPVARVMETMVAALSGANLDTETDSLEKFYESVRVRASEVTSASGKQQVIKEVYERFFRKAFRKQSEALGIVYTPVEIVDFILRAADDVSREHFGRGLTDEGVCILDPFAGTSTFTVRLLQSGLIKPDDLARKYASELFATEIMLLAYYVSAVNIETTYNALVAEAALRDGAPEPEYVPFSNIALADTFQIHEEGDIPDLNVFRSNNEVIERQKAAPINVVIGNPPYSAGQKSANDLNANLKYPTLDARIGQTYAARSTAQLKNSLYDSYLRAFRWATDRIGEQGVVAFVSNGGWIDGNTGDGVRLSMAEDFTDLYVFNLRGNQRTAGEQSRKEGGKVFGSGSRNTVAITIGVKDPGKSDFDLHYRDIGDYLSAEEKLGIVKASTVASMEWKSIVPNRFGDWLSQRSEEYETWPKLSDKKKTQRALFFSTYSNGVGTSRDSWVIGYSGSQLHDSVELLLKTYNSAVQRLETTEEFSNEKGVSEFLRQSPELSSTQKISWSRGLRQQASRRERLCVDSRSFRQMLYRPFSRQNIYFNNSLNEVQGQLPSMFPTPAHHNIGFVLTGSASHYDFGLIATDLLPNLHVLDTGQFFPRFTWAPVDAEDGGLFGEATVGKQGEASVYGEIGEVVDGYVRVDNITDEIKAIYRGALGGDVTGDDIFHFVYGKLHDPAYRTKYGADLKKMLPHIETPSSREEFDKFASAGKELMTLHVGYESVEPWPLEVDVKGDESDRETWRVLKMKWAKRKDPETGKNVNDVTKLIYNKKVTVAGIPAEADEYMLGSRSAVAWLIDRYQVKKDKASGIVNDPNDWADEVGNPRYIVDLIGRVVRVAMETVRIVERLDNGNR
ncbi:DEAD/DEAH box helicase [Corynebacterium lactis]|uniref:Helicase n=1 Tax=Corynebacterium lactis RW2-5 TaxID=1408189 RepID=A0A0K2H0E6_9CORY|nr:DEAD/DEAH box helicase [Corynebacterium lactis]ALA67504.1 helicase [Corynebacterium lactis RW2-5]